MIKVSVLYPNTEGKRFDSAYYRDEHIPMVRQRLGQACKRIEADLGLSGADLESKPPYIAMAHMYFDSVQAFQDAFGPHSREIMRDVANYTDIEPELQISEVGE